jgi:hypothetical protein
VKRIIVALVVAGCVGTPEIAPTKAINDIERVGCAGDGLALPRRCEADIEDFVFRVDVIELIDCMEGARVYRPSIEDIGNECGYPGDRTVWGCYISRGCPTYRVLIRSDLTQEQALQVWDHELRHRAADCATGNADFHHVGEYFAGVY